MDLAAKTFRLFAIAVATLVMSGVASAAPRTDVLPQSRAVPVGGTGCSWGASHSVLPLGGVFVREQDRPGRNGNEISNIAAVYYSGGDPLHKTFLGWVYRAFNGKVAYEPLVAPGVNPTQFFVSPPKTAAFDASAWLRQAAKFQDESAGRSLRYRLDPGIEKLANTSPVAVKLSWCFKSDWGGKVYR